MRVSLARAAVLCPLLAAALHPPPLVGASFAVAINELHYHPGDDSGAGEFIEIHNWGAEPADVGDWALLGGVTFVFARGTVIPPDGYLVVARDADTVIERYGLSPSLVAGSYDGSLENQGELVELWSENGFLVSYVEYDDSDPWPETADGLGPSLERVSPFLEEADASAWAPSIVVGGTPGRPNSARIELPGPSTGVSLIGRGAVWRYFKGASEPPASWAARDFDDGAWLSGPAGFGYDDGDDATILDDMLGGYSTLYIRRRFTVLEPLLVESLTLSIDYDDGYIAYLNGVEVSRGNAPGSPGAASPHDAVAPTFTDAAFVAQVDLVARRDLLVAGDNVLAVQGFNAAIDNPDFTLHPSLGAVFSESGRATETFVAPGAVWSYFRGSSAPPAEWAEPEFDPVGWEVGLAGFGFGDGDDATVLLDMNGNYLTVFIRTTFEVEDPSRVAELTLSVDYDDGFIAYVNGVEVARSLVDEPGFDRPASGNHEAGTPEDFAVASPAAVLRPGTNVIAIEGHNAGLTSGDFSLAPSLVGEILLDDGEDPPVSGVRPPLDLVINEVAPGGIGDGWVELLNVTDAALDVAGRRVQVFPAALGDYTLPSGTVVPARGRLVVGEVDLGFELEAIAACILATSDGRFIDAINPRAVPAGHSTGRLPDGDDNRVVFPVPTPAAANALDLETRVVINEIMYHPADDNAGGEFIELHNRSGAAVDVGLWSFTRGVDYVIPAGTTIPAGGFLVIARDPSAVESRYGIGGVLGPYIGGLRNDAETLLLRDAIKNPADRVRYADDGLYPEDADGLGPSLEFVHPALENRYGPAWAASAGEGTPGAPNSRRNADPEPIVVGVAHSPLVPTPSQAVRVLATISDERPLVSAQLRWEVDGQGGAPATVAMIDDGLGDDGVAGNGVFGADIPPRPDRSVVAFWFRVTGAGDQQVTVPPDAPGDAFLYGIEAAPPDEVRPVYRMVMRNADLTELRTRSPDSDTLLPLTFISDGRAYYRPGIRLRGASARRCTPRSYRIQFSHDEDFIGIKRLNLNGCNADRQWLGLDFLSRTGTATPRTWFRFLSFNGAVDNAVRLRVENIDEQFLERAFPGDDGGNLYRGQGQANLDYRGTDPDDYRRDYPKRSNEFEDDYSDLIELVRMFDPDRTSDAEFPAAAEASLDIGLWGLYFAAFAVLGSTEGGILLDRGDDYFLYHRLSDDRWVMLPWDLDSSFDEATQRLFRPTVDAIERFLEHARYAPDYWCHLENLLAGPFLPDVIGTRIDHLAPLFPTGRVRAFRDFVAARRSYVLPRINRELTVAVDAGGSLCDGVLFASASSVSLQGLAPGCSTTEVQVNGERASYDPQTNAWSAVVDVGGAERVVITAHYRDGFETDRLVVPLSGGQTTALPPVIDSDRVLTAAGSPYRAGNDVMVAQGATLRIAAGVRVLLDSDASLRVGGTLVVEGTPSSPVRFQSDGCGEQWEGIAFLPGSTANRIHRCELIQAAGIPGEAAVVVVESADLTVSDSTFEVEGALAFLVRESASLDLDGVEVSGGGAGIDATGSALAVRGCRLHDIAGAAVTARGGSATIHWTVVRNAGAGILLGDGAEGDLAHLTIHGCDTGIALGELTAGAGGATVDAHSLIVWETTSAVVVEAGSRLDLAFSDTAGDPVAGEGNISADPQFIDAAAGDFRLGFRSPCRARGKDGADMGAIAYEVAGDVNLFLPCDGNGDGSLDVSDPIFGLFSLFGRASVPACAVALDCNYDGITDLADPIYALNFLFKNGPSPKPPFPACDGAPAEECARATCR